MTSINNIHKLVKSEESIEIAKVLEKQAKQIKKLEKKNKKLKKELKKTEQGELRENRSFLASCDVFDNLQDEIQSIKENHLSTDYAICEVLDELQEWIYRERPYDNMEKGNSNFYKTGDSDSDSD
jgi:predicted  nucleic acid-binding Zn-ribbon protein